MNTDDMQKMIASDLGISELSDEEQKELITQFGAVAIQASTIAVLEALPADKRAEFTKLVEAKDEASAQALLDAALPNHEEIARQAVAAEISRFKDFQKTV